MRLRPARPVPASAIWTISVFLGQSRAPQLSVKLRITSGSGNPPDTLRWTLLGLWFTLSVSLMRVTRACGPGAPGLASPTSEPGAWGHLMARRRACSPAGHFFAAPPWSSSTSSAGADERLPAAAGRLATCEHGPHWRALLARPLPHLPALALVLLRSLLSCDLDRTIQRTSAEPYG